MANKKIPSPRAMEKHFVDIGRMLKDQQFESNEEMQKFIDGMLKDGDGTLLKMPPKSQRDYAQDIMYDAWDTDDPLERVRLAHEALAAYEYCADAYVLLGEEAAQSAEEAKNFYEKGVHAGEQDLGEDFFRENVGYFWGMYETRPYMRARIGLAQTLWVLGEDQEAIDHCREMLRLNPGDNQGIRYVLMRFLMSMKRYAEAEDLFSDDRYFDDVMAEWLYGQALLEFVKTGASSSAKKLLEKALSCNSYVPLYLCGKRGISANLSNMITYGGEDEAMSYAWAHLSTWRKVPGSIEWLANESGVNKPKPGRNDACPCGSGKKYKKCCGA